MPKGDEKESFRYREKLVGRALPPGAWGWPVGGKRLNIQTVASHIRQGHSDPQRAAVSPGSLTTASAQNGQGLVSESSYPMLPPFPTQDQSEKA